MAIETTVGRFVQNLRDGGLVVGEDDRGSYITDNSGLRLHLDPRGVPVSAVILYGFGRDRYNEYLFISPQYVWYLLRRFLQGLSVVDDRMCTAYSDSVFHSVVLSVDDVRSEPFVRRYFSDVLMEKMYRSLSDAIVSYPSAGVYLYGVTSDV